jgi:hypothetical protein
MCCSTVTNLQRSTKHVGTQEAGDVVLYEAHRYVVGAVHRKAYPHRASIVREGETQTVEITSLRIPVLSELLVRTTWHNAQHGAT